MKKKLETARNRNGFVTLVLVLLTGAIGVAIAVSVVVSGLGSSRNSLALNQSDQTKALADACAEKGLEAIRDNPSASGNGNLSLGGGSCSYTITIQPGENRVVDAVGAFGNARRKVRVNIDAIRPKINVLSWREVM